MTRFKVNFTDDELLTIKSRAAKLNMSANKYIHSMALHGVVVRYKAIEINRLIWEVNKIGVNINQIVKLCNGDNCVSQKDLEKLQTEHDKVVNLLLSVAKAKHPHGLIEYLNDMELDAEPGKESKCENVDA